MGSVLLAARYGCAAAPNARWEMAASATISLGAIRLVDTSGRRATGDPLEFVLRNWTQWLALHRHGASVNAKRLQGLDGAAMMSDTGQ
jgi:hypothetical protein